MTAGDLAPSLLGRIVRPVDYVRVLAAPMRLRSPHFAVHHLDGRPLPLKQPMTRATRQLDESMTLTSIDGAVSAPVTASLSTELSTGLPVDAPPGVDDSQDSHPPGRGDDAQASGAEEPPRHNGPQRWLGLVVPKRHAKRAVTRTLVKRQIRAIAADCAPQLEPGLWVVRQRSPFDPKQYPSAASDALKEAARVELRALFERAVRGERDKIKPRNPDGAPSRGAKGSKAAKAKPQPSPAAGEPTASSPPPATPEGSSCGA
jgi:ribonuclease P protein component